MRPAKINDTLSEPSVSMLMVTIRFPYGGGASKIVFSNGEYDPWRAGGILRNLSRTLVAVEVPQGAHHLDLMFAHDDDPHAPPYAT